MIGQTISHYKILEKLGEGGMGVVYKAEDLKLGRTVAIKVLPKTLGALAEDEKARFYQEARAASLLDHPNIETIHEVDEHEGETFIVMGYVEGQTLRQKIQHSRLKIKEAVELALQVAEGIQAAHEKGIVHRDIKSDNIMVTAKGQAKIMDFGLAKLKGAAKLTRTGSTVGTASYMSPEQIQGEEVDHRSDIWSFGVVLYEMVTQELPFKGEHEAAIAYEIVNQEPRPVGSLREDSPASLAAIAGKCLAKEPNDRYQHVDELAVDLRRVKKELESKEILKQTGVRGAVQTKKVRWLIPAALVGTLALFVIGYFLFQPQAETGEKIPIAVVDFVNETKEEELNGLSGLLITALEQSRRLSVLTRSRMFDILKQTGEENVNYIDETLGREICKQANVSVLVIGSVRKLGRRYAIDLKVLDAQRDEYLFTAKEDGEGQESIFSMIDRLAEQTRVGLKEKAAEIQGASKKVAEVSTTNLEAYQHYFVGEQLINKLKFKEAEEEFRKAIALDTTFAVAYGRLAYAMAWFSREGAKEAIRKAMQHVDKAPEKEQFLMRGVNAFIHGNSDEAIAILEELLKRYPQEKEALFNVGDLLYHKGDFTNAETYLEKVLEIDPRFERALEHLTWTHREMGRYDKMRDVAKRYATVAGSEEAFTLLAIAYARLGDLEAGLKTLEGVREIFPKSGEIAAAIADIYTFQGQHTKAASELETLLGPSTSSEAKRLGYERLSYFYPYLGRYREALRVCDKRIDLAWQAKDTSLAAELEIFKGMLTAWGWNDLSAAWNRAEKGLRFEQTLNFHRYLENLSALYLFKGDYPKVENISERMRGIHAWWPPLMEVLLSSAKDGCLRAESSVNTVLKVIPDWSRIWMLYSVAECSFKHEDLEKGEKYLLQAQNVYDNQFGWRAVYYPKSLYLLGRIYEKKGDTSLAIDSYEKLLDLWKNADKDLKELIDARSRVSRLKRTAAK